MDLASLIGVIAGAVLCIFGIVVDTMDFSIIGGFVNAPSVLITLGGSLASVLTSNTLNEFINGLKCITLAFKTSNANLENAIKQIIDLSNVARKEGLLALEEAAQEIEDPFMKKGILLIVDGTDPELVKGIMETELDCMDSRHEKVIKVWGQWASMGPAWGMIGTLIGLVNMLNDMSDPSVIGPAMAVALLTTLYGSLIANWIATPVADKLKVNNEQEIMLKSIMIEGLLSIQAGENPRVIEEKLKSFLAPSVREGMNEENEGGE